MMREIITTTAAAGRARAAAVRRKPSPIEIEQSLDQVSRWMDGLFRIPGTGWRFGLDALIGLVPGVGDAATSLVSVYILAAGVRYRVPKVTLARMGLNLALDYAVGAIPFAGDLFDFYWKSNQRNVELLRQRATVSAAEAHRGRTSDWLFLGGIVFVLAAILIGAAVVSFLALRYVSRQMFNF